MSSKRSRYENNKINNYIVSTVIKCFSRKYAMRVQSGHRCPSRTHGYPGLNALHHFIKGA